jgi:CheY-like chemotaxis protein
LVGAMHGRIEAVSDVGVGSAFSLVLPAADGVGAVDVVAGARPSEGRNGRVSVLYIEDNPQNSELMRQIVARSEGATCRLAATAAAGLRHALDDPPDLVFLDLQLPDESGERVLQQLRDHPTTATLPVVILTADASPGLRQRLLDAGADGFLTKPIDVQEVLHWIDHPGR